MLENIKLHKFKGNLYKLYLFFVTSLRSKCGRKENEEKEGKWGEDGRVNGRWKGKGVIKGGKRVPSQNINAFIS